MNTDLQAPPISPDVELRDFQFMPLDVGRLRRSKAWLICKRRPELAFYMVNLWTAAWHDLPAGSLEDDDDVLADLAMCPPKDWSRVKADVMRGWTKCSDGRLYHAVVIEKVIEAWRSKLEHAYDRECGRLRKAANRQGKKDFAPPTFEEWDEQRRSSGQSAISFGRAELSHGQDKDKRKTSHQSPAENALKGQVRDRDRDRDIHAGTRVLGTSGPGDQNRPLDDHAAFERVKAAYPPFSGDQSDWLLAERCCLQRIGEGASWPELEEGARRFATFVAAGGRSGPGYVNLPSKFFGSSKWREEWKPPPTKAEQRQAENIDAAQSWLRASGEQP